MQARNCVGVSLTVRWGWQTIGFANPDAADEHLLANPMRIPAAIHFDERADDVIAYGIQSNSTAKSVRGIYENPNFKFQIPLQAAAEREIVRFLVGSKFFFTFS